MDKIQSLIFILGIFAVMAGVVLLVIVLRKLWLHFVERTGNDLADGKEIHPKAQKCFENYCDLKNQQGKKKKILHVKHGFAWSVQLFLPKFLFGHPSLIDNFKTLLRNPNFRPLRMAVVSWFVFSLVIVFGSINFFKSVPTVPLAKAADTNIPCDGSSPDVSSYTSSDNITFQDDGDGICTLDAVLNANNVTIDAGVTLNHAVNDATGIKINAVGTVTVNGDIVVDSKGCQSWSSNSNGFGISALNGYDNYVCELGGTGGATRESGYGGPGGGHGGAGGATEVGASVEGAAYGSATGPVYLGGAGAGTYNSSCSRAGGYGGGLVWIMASGTIDVAGTISVDGGAASACVHSIYTGAGGGAGGSIWLDSGDTITGSGTLSADGGSTQNVSGGSNRGGGGGGGGRIAVTYCTDDFSTTLTTSTALGTGGSGGAGAEGLDGNVGSWSDVAKEAGDCNTAPTATDPTVTSATDGTGEISISTEVDDADDDDLQLKLEYKSGDCSSYTGQSTTTLSSTVTATNGQGSITHDNNDGDSRQFQVVDTASGANTIGMTWLSASDDATANAEHCLFITPYDGSVEGTTVSSTITLDNVSPTNPAALTVNATGTTYAVLNFPAAVTETNFKEYKIFYKTGSSGVDEDDTGFTSSTDSNLGSRTFNSASTATITGLSAGTQYVANIYAYDTYGNTSTAASELTFYTLVDQVTSAASTNSTNTTTLQVDLSWTNSSPAQSGMKLQRDNGCDGSFDVTLYDDSSTNLTSPITTSTSLSANTCYDFLFQSYNTDGAINSSTLAAATTTITTPPAQVTGLTTTNLEITEIAWDWDDITGSNFYRIYNNSDGSLIATTADSTSAYTHSSLTANTQYTVVVRALSTNNGEGIASSEASAYTDASAPSNLSHTNQTGDSMRWTWTDGGQKNFYARDKNNTSDNSGTITDAFWDQTSLTTNTAYTMEVKARNTNDIDTAYTEVARYTSQSAVETLTFSSITASSITVTASNNDGDFPNNGTGSSVISFYNNETGTLQDVTSGALWAQTNLSANVPYGYTASSTNGDGDRTTQVYDSTYTLANTPGTPTIGTVTASTMPITIVPNSNSTSTVYAIFSGTDNAWLAADGATSATAVYQTTSTWGGTVTATGLTANTAYQYVTIAKNGNNILTASSTSSTLTYTDVASNETLVDGATMTLTNSQKTGVVDGTPGSGTGNITQIEVESSVEDDTNAIVDLGRIIQDNEVTITKELNISRQSDTLENNFVVTIPANTVISDSDGTWDGELIVPTVKANSTAILPSNRGGDARKVITVGFSGGDLTFDNAVLIILPGQTGTIPAYTNSNGVTYEITTECNSATDSTNISGSGECYFDNGGSMLIWTKHFTDFFVFASNGSSASLPESPSISISPITNTNQQSQAILINDGAEKTFSREATLTLNVLGATMVALSNTPSFELSSFVPYDRTINWVLSAGEGIKEVFVRFRTEKGGTADSSDTIELVGQTDEQTDEQEQIQDQQTCLLQVNKPYKHQDSRAVWYITENTNQETNEPPCYKRLFRNPTVFFSYFTNWTEVQTIDKETLNNIQNHPLGFLPWGPHFQPTEDNLLKTISSPKVYSISNLKKYWIVSEEVFNSLGYSWINVLDVVDDVIERFGGE